MHTPLHDLVEHGQSPWVDYLSRPFVRGGELDRLAARGVSGVTSNPTIFRGAMTEGDAYDEQLREQLRRDSDPKETFLGLAVQDVRAACDELRSVFEASRTRQDGWVSLEVDPRLAHDTDGTITEAVRLSELVARPNLMVKIPGTTEGLPAIEETIARGIPVNVTLLFSLKRHRQAAEAYLRGLRRLRDSGGDLRKVASVASFFVSRVDTEADRRLRELGGHDDLLGTLAVANARLAYGTYLKVFNGPEWRDLSEDGATPQWCLWASTSMKDRSRPDVFYVEQLIGPGTVVTMPPETVEAFADHGSVADRLAEGVAGARHTLEAFAAAGVDYDDVVATLEREGVEKFTDSFRGLIDGIENKRGQLLDA
ncbi:transaldolase [Amycolatopsis sp. DSM 110486]|uniref:transaldolase n=1 Tax=Amycolatopsis sp. DSM 110486 TaxID=2865832 RepID=UPI001C6A8009|nr:transaldolase [Amycolatopsis sp. DSM 110486]QYN19126.1 transaldolase [Amycolatopsis sp. DSM 110486]